METMALQRHPWPPELVPTFCGWIMCRAIEGIADSICHGVDGKMHGPFDCSEAHYEARGTVFTVTDKSNGQQYTVAIQPVERKP